MYYTSHSVYEFISKQTNDPIIERKTCRISGTNFPIFQSDLEFYKKISPSFDGRIFSIPTPTLCPEERQRRRLMFRNERKLYKRKCDATGESIISIYSPDKPFPVYKPGFWWSDERDVLTYGVNFDFTKRFSTQFEELKNKVPMPTRTAGEETMENSDYCNEAGVCKNCYLAFEIGICEDCYYSRGLVNCKNCTDGLNSTHCEKCYNIIESHGCYNSQDLLDCINCRDCFACTNCTNCIYCIDCTNLVGKEYYINNNFVGKETYEQTKKINNLLAKIYSKKAVQNVATENCFGNYLTNTKNAIRCFSCGDVEDCHYCDGLLAGEKNTNSRDVSHFGMGTSYCYESQDVGGNPGSSHHILFSTQCRPCSNLLYCHHCVTNSNNLFGCVGLRNKSYCIFNKQYTKQEYEALVPKIITHMMETGERGEFFDPSLSPFGYNETVAQEYFPMTKEEATVRNYAWQDKSYDPTIPDNVEVLKGDQIPKDITTVSDDILKKIFVCEVSGRPFRLIKQELDFYRKHNLPLPKKHPDIRHKERMEQRPPRELHLRTCDKCSCEMVSVYPQVESGKGQVTSQKVYCEKCYTQEVYG